MTKNDDAFDALVSAAIMAREQSYAPYSEFKVGAALEVAGGAIVVGGNVENASYGLTICAERVAIGAAVTAGHRQFVRMVVAAESDRPVPPCGACRQVMSEFAPDLEVIGVNLRSRTSHGPTITWRLRELFPEAFRLDIQ